MKRIILGVFLLSGAFLQAQNLIRNGEFDNKLNIECRYDAAGGVHKRHIITEDRTWNKCLKVETLKYTQDKLGKLYYLSLRFGGDSKNNGFKVKPNTLYDFTFEIKGKLSGRFIACQWNGPQYWKNMKHLKVNGDIRFSPSDTWSVYRGSFQTGPDATHAAVGISISGRERYKNLPPLGSFLLIDKIKVTEKAALLAPRSSAKVKFTVPLKKAVLPNKEIGGFSDYKTGAPAKVNTFVTVIPGEKNIKVKVRCVEPEMAKIKANVTGVGGNVWRDDLVEIFFGPVKNDRSLSQFAVTAGGGRWMGRGQVKVDPADYARWSASVTRSKDQWSVEAVIPYELLGSAGRPDAGKLLGFNVARTRSVSRELSSLAFARGSFHSTENYALLFTGSFDQWLKKSRETLKKEASAAKAAQILKNINAWDPAAPDRAIQESGIFKKEIAAFRLGERKFVVTPINPSTDPAIPMIPAELADVPKRVKFRAAGNEFKALPLAVTNLTDQVEEYRVLISAVDKFNREIGTLQTRQGKLFPAEKIQLLRGVRSKDSDGKIRGMRFDALVPVDLSSTVVVQPREATPVWAVFDTAGVAPGKYTGVIRVIPLSDAAPNKKNGITRKHVRDLPVEFEVLPFELSKSPAIPQFYFSPAYGGEKSFRMMQQYGINAVLVNTWGFTVWFNADGSVKERKTERAEKQIRDLQEYARRMGVEKDLRIGVAYSAYILFRTRYAKQFKYGTPPWEKAWRNYIRILEDIRKKANIPHGKFFIEIADEPKKTDMPELLHAAKIALEEVPGINFMITFASWDVGLKNMEAMIPYISHWCFWGTKYLAGAAYAPLLKKLRALKKNISFYVCDTSMRVDLHKYYVTHNWRAFAHKLDMCNLYQFMTHRHLDQDWKAARGGEVALYTPGGPVSTIRLECLRIGATDIKYMKKLAEILDTPSAKRHTALHAQAAEFLKKAPYEVGVSKVHDPRQPALAREKAIDFILKLMK